MKRRTWFWMMLALFAAVVVWWMFHVPYTPRRLYSAIPANATFVSSHEDVAGRWDALSGNPVTRSLFSTMGLDPHAIDAWSRKESFQHWLGALASDQIVMAYVPSWGGPGEGVWVFSTWIGGRSQYYRWMLSWHKGLSCKRLGRHDGRDIWFFEGDDSQSMPRLSFALAEGMLVGCVSGHPGALRYVLDTLDGRSSSLWPQGASHPIFVQTADPAVHDHGWVMLGQGGSGRWEYALTDLADTGVSGYVTAPVEIKGAADWRSILGDEQLVDLFGDAPLGVVGLSIETLESFLDEKKVPGWARYSLDVAHRLGADEVLLFVLAGDYSGRIKGIRWPGLILCLPAPDEETALRETGALLDRLNARYRWGLIPGDSPADTKTIHVVESTAETPYASLEAGERAAYTVSGRWLLVSASLDTLNRLLARGDEEQAGDVVGRVQWHSEVSEKPAGGYGWIDLARGGKTMRLALTAYALKLSAGDPWGTQGRRQSINRIKAWIDGLAPLQSCRLWLESNDQKLVLGFEMGDGQVGPVREVEEQAQP